MHVHKLVYQMLESGRLSHEEIATEVRRQLPDAKTTAKSVASHAVAWRRQRGVRVRRRTLEVVDVGPVDPAPTLAKAPVEAQTTPRIARLEQIGPVIQRAKMVAREYYQLTGRPLGITGEVGEYEAARILGLALAPARAAGFDAVDGLGRKLQVKARRLPQGFKPGQRIGRIKLDHHWDAVLVVLLSDELEAFEIWESSRELVEQALVEPGSRARNERGALSISKFKQIGVCVWRVSSPD